MRLQWGACPPAPAYWGLCVTRPKKTDWHAPPHACPYPALRLSVPASSPPHYFPCAPRYPNVPPATPMRPPLPQCAPRHHPKSSNIWFMRFLLRVLVSAAALGVATAAVPGIELLAGSGWSKVGTLLGVALIFGLINATLKPLIKVIGCAFYVLTLGLAALVVNGLLLWLTSVIAGDLTLPFHVTGFWPAFWGAIIVGLVSWLLHLLIGDDRRRNDEPPPVRVVRVR